MTEFINIQNHYLPYSKEHDSIYFIDAQGCTFYDENNNSYLNLNEISFPLGYKHPIFTDTVSQLVQTKMMGHMSSLSKDKELVIENIMKVTNHDFNQVFIAGIGGEAVDWSVKIARNKTGKDGIISFHNALHGRSFAGAYLSGIDRRKKGFGSGLEHVYFHEFDKIEDYNKNNDIAAVLIEPYQALGGMKRPSIEYLTWLRKYTKENNILLIFDEIQTGFGKTGTFFAYQHLGIVPDILIMGKGMSNGFGVSALLTNSEFVSNMDTTALAGGSADNDFFCSVVNCVFDIYEKEKILDHVNEMNAYIQLDLKDYTLQGNGLFLSVITENTNEIISKCKEKGVIFGKTNNSILIRPPLIISKEELKYALETLKEFL